MSETVLFKSNRRLRRRMCQMWFRDKDHMIKELVKAFGHKAPRLQPADHTPKNVIRFNLLKGVQIHE